MNGPDGDMVDRSRMTSVVIQLHHLNYFILIDTLLYLGVEFCVKKMVSSFN